MASNNQNNEAEDNDLNKQEPHDALEAGKKAIEAEKIANEGESGSSQQKDPEDAEKWRNEG